jgi:hypothetical protein
MTHTADNDAPTMGQWAHDVSAQYRTLAASEGWAVRRDALTRAADEYDAIGRRMDRITRVIPSEGSAS